MTLLIIIFLKCYRLRTYYILLYYHIKYLYYIPIIQVGTVEIDIKT